VKEEAFSLDQGEISLPPQESPKRKREVKLEEKKKKKPQSTMQMDSLKAKKLRNS